jgi:hypothetical protein
MPAAYAVLLSALFALAPAGPAGAASPALPAAAPASPAAGPALPGWESLDQTGIVQRERLYDYARECWRPENFLPGPSGPARFRGPNEPGGPAFPAAALAHPDLYTYDAIRRRNHDARRDRDGLRAGLLKPLLVAFVFPGAGRDEVPPMPLVMLDTLRSYLQPGDLILQSNDPGDRREKRRDQYMHAILYLGGGLVVHAIGVPRETVWGPLKPSVFLSTLESGIQRDVDGADRLVVLRPTRMTQSDFNRVARYALGEVGKPYDFALNARDDARHYCTELPAHAFQLLERPLALAPDPALPLGLITGRSYFQALQRGDFSLVLALNPKTHARVCRPQ